MPVFFISAGGASTPDTTILHSNKRSPLKQINSNTVFGFNSLQSGPKFHLQLETHSSSAANLFLSQTSNPISQILMNDFLLPPFVFCIILILVNACVFLLYTLQRSAELGALHLLVTVLLCAFSAPWLLSRPQFYVMS